MPVIQEGVFYITNTCNLTCNNCMTYNNRKFTGHFNWQDTEDEITQWSKRLHIERITILGGEPFVNPELINWATNIKRLWSNSDINVCTNGTYLVKKSKIVRELLKHNIWLDICVHDANLWESIIQDFIYVIRNISYHTEEITMTDIGHHPYTVTEYYSGNQLLAKISKQWNFSSISTEKIVNGVTYMRNSDPALAHKNCSASKCHYFVNGKLYKCYQTGVAKEFVKQYKIEETAKALLLSYSPCSVTDDVEAFVSTIEDPIEQCSLCPEKRISNPIWPLQPVKEKI